MLNIVGTDKFFETLLNDLLLDCCGMRNLLLLMILRHFLIIVISNYKWGKFIRNWTVFIWSGKMDILFCVPILETLLAKSVLLLCLHMVFYSTCKLSVRALAFIALPSFELILCESALLLWEQDRLSPTVCAGAVLCVSVQKNPCNDVPSTVPLSCLWPRSLQTEEQWGHEKDPFRWGPTWHLK